MRTFLALLLAATTVSPRAALAAAHQGPLGGRDDLPHASTPGGPAPGGASFPSAPDVDREMDAVAPISPSQATPPPRSTEGDEDEAGDTPLSADGEPAVEARSDAERGPRGASEPGADVGSAPQPDALSVVARDRLDAYGQRPPDVPTLSLDQILEYALQNPLVQSAKQEVEAMQAQVQKTKFAWIPVISTEMSLMPGANITCDDVVLPGGQEFQYCRSPRKDRDDDFNLNRAGDYFRQLGDAGVRFEFRANAIIPITTFGKLLNLKKLAHVGLLLKKLEQARAEHETILRVHQAYTTLVLARESLAILREADAIAAKAVERVRADLGGDAEEDWDAELDEAADDVDLARDPVDLFKAELAAVEIAELSRQARRIEAVSLSALWALAGRAAPPGFDIEAPRQPLYAVEGGLKDVREYKETALQNRPEAKMAAAAVAARRHQERMARANFLPDLGVLLSFAVARSNAADRDMRELYYTNGFNYSRLTLALAMRWKWDFHMKAFDLRAARAAQRSAGYQEEAARLLLALDVEQAYQALVEATHVIELKRHAIELAWKLVVSAQQKDTLGGGNAGELVKYLETWYRKRFELAEAIQHHNQAVARLSRAVGTQLASTAGR